MCLSRNIMLVKAIKEYIDFKCLIEAIDKGAIDKGAIDKIAFLKMQYVLTYHAGISFFINRYKIQSRRLLCLVVIL